jgi:sugar/nucleoside kinase (ribokinase family)
MSLLVVGTLAYDTIETVFERREDVLGGSAVYFAMGASRFAPVSLVGVVGEDFRKADADLLTRSGVETRGIERARGKTFRWSGRYEGDWNKRVTLATDLNVLATFDPKIPDTERTSRFLFLANASPEVQLKSLAQVEAPAFTMMDTMNLWIDVDLQGLREVLRKVDAIVLNDEEARMLTGEKNLIKAAGAVLGLGPRYVVLKKGEHGAFLMGGDVHFAIPAYPVENVVDPTGAGDSFAGGFLGYLAGTGKHDPRALRKAMLYGTVTASFCVERFGVEALASLDRTRIDERYDELLQIVTV